MKFPTAVAYTVLFDEILLKVVEYIVSNRINDFYSVCDNTNDLFKSDVFISFKFWSLNKYISRMCKRLEYHISQKLVFNIVRTGTIMYYTTFD